VGSQLVWRLDVRGRKMDKEIGSLKLVKYNLSSDPKF